MEGDGGAPALEGDGDAAAMDFMARLNPQQREAATVASGPVLILAGPGSGKTSVVTARVGWLITAKGADPRGIVLVTFTKKAAGEMDQRLREIVGAPADDVLVGTFHAVALRFLRRNAHLHGDGRPSIVDEGAARRIVAGLLREDPKGYSVAAATMQAWISHEKNCERTPEQTKQAKEAAGGDASARHLLSRIYASYEAELAQLGKMDFDDILVRCLALVRAHPDVVASCEHIIVDEFQDTNMVQFRLAKLLAHTGNLTVVGDPDQSIYGWRSADKHCFKRIEQDYPHARVIPLQQNYRSTASILSASALVLASDREASQHAQWTGNGDGPPVVVLPASDAGEEGLAIAREIERIFRLSGGRVILDDFAVLMRTNQMGKAVEQVFRDCGLPYKVVGGTDFFSRAEVQDCIHYLRLIANPHDDAALRRIVNVPRRQVGPVMLGQLEEVAKSRGQSLLDALSAEMSAAPAKRRLKRVSKHTVQKVRDLLRVVRQLHKETSIRCSDALHRLVDAIGYEDHLHATHRQGADGRIANVSQLIAEAEKVASGTELPHDGEATSSAVVEHASIKQFLARVSVMTGEGDSAEGGSSRDGAVTLSTIHAAKGLEWACVFVVGVEDGSLPHANALQQCATTGNESCLDEERRLLYVRLSCDRGHSSLAHAVLGASPASFHVRLPVYTLCWCFWSFGPRLSAGCHDPRQVFPDANHWQCWCRAR